MDERSEIAGSFQGLPQLDVGLCTDVLDACPKAEGMMMLLRSMAPEVMVTDEIGSEADAAAIEEVLHAGVAVIATAHAGSITEPVQAGGCAGCRRCRFLKGFSSSRSRGVGTVEQIIDPRSSKVYYRCG